MRYIIAILFILYVVIFIAFTRLALTITDSIIQKFSVIPAVYTVIKVDETARGTDVSSYEVHTMRLVECRTDMECYQMCIEAGGQPDWCEEGLMKGDHDDNL